MAKRTHLLPILLLLAALAPGAAAGTKDTVLPAATPEATGMSKARLAAMDEHFRREAERGHTPGYVLMVARNGLLVHTATLGMRDREAQLPMTLDTRFRIASMTKPVTSVAVLMLYEEGRLQLDDPVSMYLPAFAQARVYSGTDDAGTILTEPAKRPITIRHLLTHTSGLGYAPGYDRNSPLATTWAALDFNREEPADEKIRRIARMPLYTQPGEAWRYSYADDVLGRLVEVVAGMPFPQFLQTRLFDPLGMRHTGFFVPEKDLSLLAVVYKHAPDGALERTEGWPAGSPTRPPAFASGGGGLISTAGDYLRFAQMLANGGSLNGRQYLSPVTIRLMTSNQVADDAMQKYWGDNSIGLGYGFGVAPVFDARFTPQANLDGDYSWGGFLDTHWIVSPQSGLVAVLLTQLNPLGNTTPQRTYVDFRNLLFAAVARLDTP